MALFVGTGNAYFFWLKGQYRAFFYLNVFVGELIWAPDYQAQLFWNIVYFAVK